MRPGVVGVATDLIWAGLLVTAGVLETWAIVNSRAGKDAGTLTDLVRRVFRTGSVAGRVVFSVLWAVFAVWFLVHILAGG